MIENRKFIIWGARGHALVLAEILFSKGNQVVAFFDQAIETEAPIEGIPIYHGIDSYRRWIRAQRSDSEICAISAIGGTKGKDRLHYLAIFKSDGLETPAISHKNAFISTSATVGNNAQILAMASVGPCCSIGQATIVNTGAIVDHECVLGDGVHISPGVTLCGCIEVGPLTLIGSGAVVLPRIKIGENSIIGAGAVVTKDLPDNIVAYGVPAKIVRDND